MSEPSVLNEAIRFAEEYGYNRWQEAQVEVHALRAENERYKFALLGESQKLLRAEDALREIAALAPNAGDLSTQPVGIARAYFASVEGDEGPGTKQAVSADHQSPSASPTPENVVKVEQQDRSKLVSGSSASPTQDPTRVPGSLITVKGKKASGPNAEARWEPKPERCPTCRSTNRAVFGGDVPSRSLGVGCYEAGPFDPWHTEPESEGS